ncbi:dTDP-4-dehydrorhamnose reductase [Hyphomicrobium sp.]|jgi:dTDP-4-dehydrorhamnose reductase|uniref:dTDP-4-dehydrorhamnose reductase n=1 Tax=Hyphomicrobium sp. TaxID=82 RepID=UPI003565FCB5
MTSRKQRVLIIGQNGQVSRSLYEVLSASGHHVVKIGRPDVDLCNRASVAQAIRATRPSIVVNAAAYTAVDRAEDEPEAAFATNATGAQAAAEAAAEAGAVIIHFSTDYVFDGTKRKPYVETDAVAPAGVYGKSKLAGERLVAAVNAKHIILRTAWVFSPFGSNFAKTILRLNQERPEINVVDDQHGNPTYAPDLAEVVRQIIGSLGASPSDPEIFGTFHAVNSGETTWHAFASAIIDGAAQRGGPRAAILPIATTEYPTKALRPAYSVLSTDKLADVYGIRFRPWSEALSDGLDRLIGPLRDETTQCLQQDVGQSR